MSKRAKRPRDTNQLAKFIVDVATGVLRRRAEPDYGALLPDGSLTARGVAGEGRAPLSGSPASNLRCAVLAMPTRPAADMSK